MRYLTNFNRKIIPSKRGRIMAEQLTTNTEALKLFFSDDIYLLANENITGKEEVNEPEKKEPVEMPAAVVAEPVTPPEVTEIRTVEFSYLGKNARNILILVCDPQNQVSTEEGRELLRKIVKAIDLSATDFALVNCAAYQGVSFAEFQTYFKPRLLLSFGVLPEQIGLAGQQQHSLMRQGDIDLIFSSELHALSEDMNGKKALWASLKQLNVS